MARCFSNAKALSALIIDGLSTAINRRGFAAMASSSVEKRAVERSPWVPDPVTGYYRPENRAGEINVAELRELLLKQQKIAQQQQP
ncbi:hypothetical protein GIB67_022926 [Kingdonia uniflora]|uniref:Late embryogenesis abundant protein Lea5 n=1 Tax=Kingdonia uniflora TaxID=39325 RepID=A0A7J7P289_9MAGN|nr:hypothetical protein GIB67_022926 [Kingdonia uniflora]